MAKVRPLLSMINERFLRKVAFMKQQNLSIDEAIIRYFGKHGAKQLIRGKPTRLGYKMWVPTTPLGYVLQFEAYQNTRGRQTEYPGLGMGGSAEEIGSSHRLTFENLFTSCNFVDCLTSKGIVCTGTLRSNRHGGVPLKSVKEMEKLKRGSFDFATDTKNGMVVVRWNDNSVVNTVSHNVRMHPLQSKSDAKRIDTGQPFLIKHYNKTMGGVDRMAQYVDKYHTTILSKK